MRSRTVVLVAPVVAMIAIGIAAAAVNDPVPLFTSEDLDRMFGPAPAQPSEAVDKSRAEDWRWIEEFLDRQYSRIEADRQFDLSNRIVDVAVGPIEPPPPIYQGSVAWRLGYPASNWLNVVRSKYASRAGGAACHALWDGGFQIASAASHDHDHSRGQDHPPGHKAK